MVFMNQLDVLVIGNLKRSEDGSILDANSTSTLIKADGRLIVVDTSTVRMRPAIKVSFKQIGVFMKDVDTVILTHMHHDHAENTDLYPNAEVYVHSGDENIPSGYNVVDSDTEIADGVRLVHTPGHTLDSMSVFVHGDGMRYVIAGDAIPLKDNCTKMLPPAVNISKELSIKSIKTITNFADVIIPGHGQPFMTGR
ncbi:MAG: MBL fold metallo-hydrolase [Candidatus Methanomethylophilaceae archaeon]